MTVSALLLFNGTDGSTTFTDETGNQTWSAGGTGTVAELDDVQSVHGGTSLKTDDGQYVGATLATSITGEFTVEFWGYLPADITGTVRLASIKLGATYYFELQYNSVGDSWSVNGPWGGSTIISAVTNEGMIQTGQWFHFVIYRDKNNAISGLINGYREASLAPYYHATYTTPALTEVYFGDSHATSSFDGWIDSARVSTDHIYQSGILNPGSVNPGLTYTVLAQDIAIDPWGDTQIWGNPAAAYQVHTPFTMLDDVMIIRDQIVLSTEEVNAGTGIQIWS